MAYKMLEHLSDYVDSLSPELEEDNDVLIELGYRLDELLIQLEIKVRGDAE